MRTIQYPNFVWKVFLLASTTGRIFVASFISGQNKIYVSDFQSSEELHIISGKPFFAGLLSLYEHPVIICLVNESDIKILNAETGVCLRHISGGFENTFRGVVSHGSNPILVFNTWNSLRHQGSIKSYELSLDSGIEPTAAVEAQVLQQLTSYQEIIQPSIIAGPVNPCKMKCFFECDSRDNITSLAISKRCNPVVCSGHYDNVVRVWDLASLKLLAILEGHSGWVVSVAIWPGSEQMLVSGSADGTIKVVGATNDRICSEAKTP